MTRSESQRVLQVVEGGPPLPPPSPPTAATPMQCQPRSSLSSWGRGVDGGERKGGPAPTITGLTALDMEATFLGLDSIKLVELSPGPLETDGRLVVATLLGCLEGELGGPWGFPPNPASEHI